MVYTRNISDSIVWVGGSDRRLALFENLFPIPRGSGLTISIRPFSD